MKLPAALLAALLLVCSCSAERTGAPSPWAIATANKHAQADTLLEQGDPIGAQRVLESILADAPRPADAPDPETVRVLLQDTHYRLAELSLRAGQTADAVRIADAGIALGDADDLYTANLLIVRGSARESLREAEAALADYERALRINERLLQETLEPR